MFLCSGWYVTELYMFNNLIPHFEIISKLHRAFEFANFIISEKLVGKRTSSVSHKACPQDLFP